MNAYTQILNTLKVKGPGAAIDELAEQSTNSVFFIGIGGIGMSALARYFKSLGVKVTGYDKTATPLTRQLLTEGIGVQYEDSLSAVDRDAQLVVYTPAIPTDSAVLNFYRNDDYTVVKRSDVLGAITANSFNICVAGTHGKTTTSTMVAHILQHSGFGCNAFLGGIAVNYNSNFWSSTNNVAVVEADEYDRSFLKLSPDVTVITSMDPDHLDIYGTSDKMEQAFIDFSRRLKPGGLLISKHGLSRADELSAKHHISYAIQDENADAFAHNIQNINGSYRFDVTVKSPGSVGGWNLQNVLLHMGGLHNIENVLAAIIAAHHVKISDDKIRSAIAEFRGVKRRFEYILKDEAFVFIDDYAHHPEELRALIKGAKNLFPGKQCTIVFQPHLFSRTKDFANEFAEALDLADEVILLPIYPAREQPMEGITSQLILDWMKNETKKILTREEVLKQVSYTKNSLVITAGAGDIDALVAPLKQQLEKQMQMGN